MKVGTILLCVLALQLALQTKAVRPEFANFRARPQRHHFAELLEYMNGLGNPNALTPQEVERITKLTKITNENLRFSSRQLRAVPSAGPAPSVCEERSSSSIFVFGKCPDVCQPFSTKSFNECGSLIQFGCELAPCGAGSFTCKLRQDLTSDLTVCPGDKVIFDDVELRTFQEVSFKIDLQAPPLRTDLYLLSDATDSMKRAIATVQRKFRDLINVFDGREHVAFGVGFYRDEVELSNGFENSQPITENRNSVRTAVDNLSTSGGGDKNEANLVALYKVATDSSIGWRDGSRRILVYFGDNPGHEPTCAGSKKITRSEVIAALNAKHITVIGVSFPPGIDNAPRKSWGSCHSDGPAGPGQASDIASGTSGQLVSRDDQRQLVAAIDGAVGTLSRTYDVDESECSDKIDSTHTPTLPLTLESSESTTVTNTISLKDSICAIVGSFECSYKYTESGADLDGLNMEFVNIRGCPH